MFPRWDIATRLFHWSLIIAVLLSWVSQQEDYIQVHIYSGYGVLVLVGFRILWGLMGSVHSRFSNFLRSPTSVWQYLRGEAPMQVGHNPVGGWSVILILFLLLAQVVSGLFNTDELIYSGPLHHLLEPVWADRAGEWHEWLFCIFCAVIAVHILAVAYHQLVRKHDLMGPMLHGGQDGSAAPSPLWLALIIVALVAGALALGLSFVPAPELPW